MELTDGKQSAHLWAARLHESQGQLFRLEPFVKASQKAEGFPSSTAINRHCVRLAKSRTVAIVNSDRRIVSSKD